LLTFAVQHRSTSP